MCNSVRRLASRKLNEVHVVTVAWSDFEGGKRPHGETFWDIIPGCNFFKYFRRTWIEEIWGRDIQIYQDMFETVLRAIVPFWWCAVYCNANPVIFCTLVSELSTCVLSFPPQMSATTVKYVCPVSTARVKWNLSTTPFPTFYFFGDNLTLHSTEVSKLRVSSRLAGLRCSFLNDNGPQQCKAFASTWSKIIFGCGRRQVVRSISQGFSWCDDEKNIAITPCDAPEGNRKHAMEEMVYGR